MSRLKNNTTTVQNISCKPAKYTILAVSGQYYAEYPFFHLPKEFVK